MEVHKPLIQGGTGGYREFIMISDVKSSGTDGGTFTSGAMRTRDLNTIDVDETGLVTLTANQFVLPLGTYEIQASAPCFKGGPHKAKLQNITAGTAVILGTSEHTSTGDNPHTSSFVQGRFTIAASTTFEIQHQNTTSNTTTGFGVAGSLTTELYAVVRLWRIKK